MRNWRWIACGKWLKADWRDVTENKEVLWTNSDSNMGSRVISSCWSTFCISWALLLIFLVLFSCVITYHYLLLLFMYFRDLVWYIAWLWKYHSQPSERVGVFNMIVIVPKKPMGSCHEGYKTEFIGTHTLDNNEVSVCIEARRQRSWSTRACWIRYIVNVPENRVEPFEVDS